MKYQLYPMQKGLNPIPDMRFPALSVGESVYSASWVRESAAEGSGPVLQCSPAKLWLRFSHLY